MKIKELIEKLEQKSSHQFLKAVSKPEFTFSLPKDLEFFLQHPVSQHIKMKVMK